MQLLQKWLKEIKMKIPENRLKQIINEEIKAFKDKDSHLADYQTLYEKLGSDVLLEQIKQKLLMLLVLKQKPLSSR